MPNPRARRIAALGWALALACSETPTELASMPGPAERSPVQHDPTPVIEDSDGEITGGQTGSGGIWPPFSCDRLASGACASSLADGFVAKETPLVLANSECVPATSIDATLDGTPVCNCSYTAAHYFSDTGGRTSLSLTLGLERRRAMLGGTGDECEFRLPYATLDNPCLLESAAFGGCSLDAPSTSCEAACQAASQNHAAAVARARANVEVLSSTCIACPGGYCAGILRAGEQCFFGLQFALGVGFFPVSVTCGGSPDDQVAAQIALYFDRSCRSVEPSCDAPGSTCPDAGDVNAPVLDASVMDASTSDADAAGSDGDSGP